MDAPKKTRVSAKGKATPMKMAMGKHAVDPTMQNPGYGGGKKGAHALDGAHGNRAKYC